MRRCIFDGLDGQLGFMSTSLATMTVTDVDTTSRLAHCG